MKLKAYLENFFKIYNYDEKDSLFLIGVYDKIKENPETYSLFNKAMDMYRENVECDYDEIILIADKIAEILYLHEFTVEFLIFVCLSEIAKDVYEQKGFSYEMFYNNMYDLKYKFDECKLVYNITGSFVAFWFPRFFKLTRFTFGRLQFELSDFKRKYNKNGRILTPESKVVNVHIPRSPLPFDEKSCDEAFMMAKEFFKDEFEDEIPFCCHSWILYPENKNILSEKSNTYRFMQRFEIIDELADKNFNNLWRIFDTMEKRPEKLPENSFIQKAYKAHLLNGGKIGTGAGVFFVKK